MQSQHQPKMQDQSIMAEKHQNSFLLPLLTTSVAWMVPLAFLYHALPVVPVIRAAMLTSALATCALVVALIFFTSWAEKRSHHLSFLGPFLLLCFVPILVLCFLQWKTCITFCNGLTAFVSCGYIAYFSSSLMRHASSRDKVLGTISLFLNTASLFLNLFYMLIGY